MGDLVSRARELAHRAHAGQADKAGRPYIEHVARVAEAVADDPEAEAVAWLHDVWEDAPKWMEANVSTFPLEIVFAVRDLTRTGNDDFDYWRVRNNPVALRIKLADIADNSDESRLAMLDDVTSQRLRRKYAKALRMLASPEAGRDG